MGEEITTSWTRWKSILAPILQAGDFIGISEGAVSTLACRLGDFLQNRVDPKSPEQRMLKDLWDVAYPEEQQLLAKLLIRGIKEGNTQK